MCNHCLLSDYSVCEEGGGESVHRHHVGFTHSTRPQTAGEISIAVEH